MFKDIDKLIKLAESDDPLERSEDLKELADKVAKQYGSTPDFDVIEAGVRWIMMEPKK